MSEQTTQEDVDVTAVPDLATTAYETGSALADTNTWDEFKANLVDLTTLLDRLIDLPPLDVAGAVRSLYAGLTA